VVPPTPEFDLGATIYCRTKISAEKVIYVNSRLYGSTANQSGPKFAAAN
jgi:hypothetical protein